MSNNVLLRDGDLSQELLQIQGTTLRSLLPGIADYDEILDYTNDAMQIRTYPVG
jgi:hypothetical protein